MNKKWRIINLNVVISSVSYLSLRCIGNPSSSHSKVGGGFPFAIHLSETDGPGWRVCSENLYKSAGIASEKIMLLKNVSIV